MRQKVKVQRDGKHIGTYQPEEMLHLLTTGTLKPTDLYSTLTAHHKIPLSKFEAYEKFRCHCCQATFWTPVIPSRTISNGVIMVLVGICMFLVNFLPRTAELAAQTNSNSLADSKGFNEVFLVFWNIASVLLFLAGFSVSIVSGIKSPHCPHCQSQNFSKQIPSSK